MVHVDDAARAIVHIAGLPRIQVDGHSFVVSDGSGARFSEFMNHAAELMSARPPGHAPRWLASLVAGRILVEAATRDIATSPDAILRTGFRFRYPSFKEGLPPTLKQLGYLRSDDSGPFPSPKKTALPVWILLICVIAAIVAENGFEFPLSVPYMTKMAGGLSILDARFHYTSEACYQLFDALGNGGRTAYLELLWTVDLIFPALFSCFLWTLIRYGALSRFRWIGFAAGIFDYLENLTITFLLLHYPVHATGWAVTASLLTSVKHSFYGLGALMGVLGLILTRLPFAKIPPRETKKSGRRANLTPRASRQR
jgi:hypothetical protein